MMVGTDDVALGQLGFEQFWMPEETSNRPYLQIRVSMIELKTFYRPRDLDPRGLAIHARLAALQLVHFPVCTITHRLCKSRSTGCMNLYLCDYFPEPEPSAGGAGGGAGGGA